MTVLLVCPLFHPVIGGGETYTLNLARMLSARGWDVVVAASPEKDRDLSDYTFTIEEIDGLSEDTLNIHKTSPQLHELITSCQPDVIHTHGYFALLAIGLVNAKTPVVASVHNTPVEGERLFRGFDDYNTEMAFARNTIRLSRPHAFIAGSAAYRDMAEHVLMPGVELHHMYYPVDLEFFSSASDYAQEKDSTTKLICVPSRIVRRKGIADAVAALDFLDDKYQLLLVGATKPVDNDYWQEVKDSQSWKNNAHRIIVPDKTILYDDLPACYGKSSVIAMPSYFEGFGLAALESMAAKTPVVVTGVQGFDELVKDGFNGLLVPSKDPVALAKTIKRVVEDMELREHLIEGGVESAKKYSWQKHLDEISRIYLSAQLK